MQVPTLKAWLFSGCKMVASLLLTMPARMASSAAFSLPFCGLGPAMTALLGAVPSCGTTACCGIEIPSSGAAFKTTFKAAVQFFIRWGSGCATSIGPLLPSGLSSLMLAGPALIALKCQESASKACCKVAE